MRLLSILGALETVKNLVPLIDAGAWFLLTRKADGILEIPDDPAVSQVQFRREVEINVRSHVS